MQRTATLFFSLLFLTSFLSGQIPVAGDTLFGNEWFVPGKNYLRVEVAADGMYRVDPATLSAAGLPESEGEGQRFRLFHMGRPVPLDLSAGGVVFHGERAGTELDTLMFAGGSSELLNTRYGLYTDTAAYYLTTVPEVTADERITAGTPGSGANPTTTLYRTAEQLFTAQHAKFYLRSSGSTVMFSHYELSEGFGSRNNNDLLSSNGTRISTASVNLPNGLSGAASLTVRFGLAFGDEHRQRISIDGVDQEEFTSEDWSVNQREYAFSSTGTKVALKLEGLSGAQDKANLAFVSVNYPARAVLDGPQLPFYLPGGGEVALNFTSPPPAGTRLYDLTNGRVYGAGSTGFALPAAASRRDFVAAREFLAPAATAAVTLDDLVPPAGTDYLIVSSRRLAGAGLDALASYRQSATGGSHRVHLVYVEDLYDAFGYGLRRHPQSIRNYLGAAMRASSDLQYLFLVGKGREYTSMRTAQGLAAAWPTFFIPSFGLPASDNLLSAPIGSILPQLSTGRLSVINPDEVALYAGKLQAVERQVTLAGQTIEDLDWMKQALFLGGGQSASEQATIQYNLGTMERIFENSKFGGHVTSVFRTSSDPIEDARQNQIFDRINAGTSIITFFGHSSSQGFDFNIDNPENYENLNRYPFMMSLGCYSGDAFTEARSISERFLLLPDGGAITYAASKGLGYISALGTYGRSVFKHLGNDQYGEGIGDALRAAIADFAPTSNFTLGILLEQFSLSGDPAFRFHPRPGPDLVIDPTSVAFDPSVVPAQDTTLKIDLTVKNLGTRAEGLPDSVTLRFRQQLPTGEVRPLADRRIFLPYYEDQLSFDLPSVGFEAVGLNRLLITIDPDDKVTEFPAPAAEQNNELVIGGTPGAPFTVVANSAKTAFPPEYAVVGPGVELIAGSSDPLAPEREYRIQVATRKNFATPLVDEVFSAPGGVLRYTPAVNFSDSTTYYWRISPDSSSNGTTGYLWSASSFTFLKDQAPEAVDFAIQDPGQFVDGQIKNIRLDSFESNWNFNRTATDFEVFNAVYQSREMPKLVVNGTRLNSPHPWKLTTGVQVLIVDSINNSKWYPNTTDGDFNSVPGRTSPWIFNTRTDAGRQGMIRFLDDYVQEGNYVIVYSIQRGTDLEYHNEGWLADSAAVNRTIYGVLEEQGAEQVRLLESLGSVPYTFVYQKGFGPIGEAIAEHQDAQTYLLAPLYENWKEGNFTTPRVGPALEWRGLDVTVDQSDIGPADSCYFQLIGIKAGGEEEILLQQPLAIRDQPRFRFDLTGYDATTYPYLQPTFALFDETDRSVATIQKIYFDYTRPGDAAISPTVALSLPERLDQGQEATVEIGYENLTPTPMDSLLVELNILDARNQLTTLRKRQAPLAGRSSDKITFNLPTEEANSTLRLQLRLNPDRDQPEDVLFNNLMNTELGVGLDYVAPDLKVYYDGRTIRDGELISARPEILVQLRDENPYRRLDDSSGLYLRLASPDGTSQTIPLSDDRVEFIPATPDGENRAELYFRPELMQDGIYTLTVQGNDRANNLAGSLNYEQTFEVVNQQLITNVLTYPNPFTSQTRFVYTLTGSAPPDVFRIQIMTVSGRVVRDIDLLALESVAIGTHQTDFAWDGTDEYGDLLANGVYLYRVITSDADGAGLEKRDNGTDQYFRNGLGKVVILR